MLFEELAESQLPWAQRAAVEQLLELKRNAPEVKEIPRIAPLNEYLERSIAEIKEEIRRLPKEQPKDWEELNRLFLTVWER